MEGRLVIKAQIAGFLTFVAMLFLLSALGGTALFGSTILKSMEGLLLSTQQGIEPTTQQMMQARTQMLAQIKTLSQTAPALWMNILVNLAAMLAGGYVVAVQTKEAAMRNAVSLGSLMASFNVALLILALLEPSAARGQALWPYGVLALLLIPAAMMGAALRLNGDDAKNATKTDS